MRVTMPGMQHPLVTRIVYGLCALLLLGVTVFSFPAILTITIEGQRERAFSRMQEEFPVTVNPSKKIILESAQVNAYLDSRHSPYQAAAGGAVGVFTTIFTWLAVGIADSPWYQALAATDGRFVNITAGMRKEQVANAFAGVLDWSAEEKKEFLTRSKYSSLPLTEGSYLPGVYIVSKNSIPLMAQALVNERFADDVLAHYSSSTARIVPLSQALTIASLIEREAAGPEDMRLISGIIWNRLFINMSLQIDATLQYVKANAAVGGNWWPGVVPADRYRKSPYNTYLHAGLPPGPIANPSIASVLAALNPKKTTCLFYFHDARGGFHCSDTYALHVASLKKYYGRGK